MNITFVLVILVILAIALRGLNRGLIKVIAEILAVLVFLFTVMLLMMLYLTIQHREVGNILITIGILVSTAVGYCMVKVLLKSVKMICRLPLIKYIDKILGIAGGAIEGILVVWIFYLFNEYGVFGNYSEMIDIHTRSNELLIWIYESNYLLKIMYV